MNQLEKVSSLFIAATIPVCFVIGLILSCETEPTGYQYHCEGFNEAVGTKWTQGATMPAATLENAREAAYRVGGTCIITKL